MGFDSIELAHWIPAFAGMAEISIESDPIDFSPGRAETPMARESEQWDPERGWLDPDAVARAVTFCLRQGPDTVIPEFHLHHQAEL